MDPLARRRFARHLLLAEVGEAGQEALSARTVSLEGAAGAVAVAELYLSRAGVGCDPAGEAARVPAVDPGRPELAGAAEFVAGALAAVEVIRQTLDRGGPAPTPPPLTGPEERE